MKHTIYSLVKFVHTSDLFTTPR